MIKPLEELDIQYIFNPILRVEGARGRGGGGLTKFLLGGIFCLFFVLIALKHIVFDTSNS